MRPAAPSPRRRRWCRCPRPFDIVITTNSGYPLDLNLYQAVKGMSAAAQVVRQGGAIIVAADCWDGIPEHGLYGQLLREADSPRALLDTDPGARLPEAGPVAGADPGADPAQGRRLRPHRQPDRRADSRRRCWGRASASRRRWRRCWRSTGRTRRSASCRRVRRRSHTLRVSRLVP